MFDFDEALFIASKVHGLFVMFPQIVVPQALLIAVDVDRAVAVLHFSGDLGKDFEHVAPLHKAECAVANVGEIEKDNAVGAAFESGPVVGHLLL